jgi:hypothetical protein
MTAFMEVISPAGPVQKIPPVVANPIPSIGGRRVAVLDNGKPGARRLAELVLERLGRDHALHSVKYFRKENPAVGAQPAVLDEIARSADLALTGTAD